MTGNRIKSLLSRCLQLVAIAFSLAGCALSRPQSYYITTAPTASHDHPMGRSDIYLQTIDMSSDGKLLAAGGKYGISVYEVETFDQLWFSTIDPWLGVNAITFTPDGENLVTNSFSEGGESIITWQSRNGQPLYNIEGFDRSISDMAFHPDGRYLAIGFWGGSVTVWDTVSQEMIFEFVQSIVREKAQQETIVSWSPDGKKLAAGGRYLTFRIWDPMADALLEAVELEQEIDSIAWSPEGTYLAISSESYLTLWNVNTKQSEVLHSAVNDINGIGGGPQVGLAWAPDGKRLALGTSDGRIIVWQVDSSRELIYVLSGHSMGVHSLEWSTNGEILFSGSYDDTIITWDLITGEQIRRFDLNS